MPEGDTVWLTCRRLNDALVGPPLLAADLRVPRLATVDLIGAVVSEVVPRGKHILIRLADGRTIHNHLRMDGSWRVARPGSPPPRPAHAIRALLGNQRYVAYGLRIHDLAVAPTADESDWVAHLGPDLLSDGWCVDEVLRRMGSQPYRSVGEALLDQRLVAGIGNVYRSEVLFLGGVHPWTPTAAVGDLPGVLRRARLLLMANRERPEQSTTGSTRRGELHWVYRRDRLPCRRCGTAIMRGEQGEEGRERSVFWCPHCQPE